MSSLNKVILLGRLGKDPELKAVNQTHVCKFSIATSEKYREKEVTEWHNIVVWGKSGENCAKYLKKGRMALVEGKIQTRSWEKDGEKRQAVEIVAHYVKFIGTEKKAEESTKESSNEPDYVSFDNIPF